MMPEMGIKGGVGAQRRTTASPIFQDMSVLPTSPGVDKTKYGHGLPIVKLSENGRAIQILRSCYDPTVYITTLDE